MQGKPYKIRDFLQNPSFAMKASVSHPEAQNGIKTLRNLLPYATQMQTGCINSLFCFEFFTGRLH
jgi:hypothetical protein